MPFLSVMIPVYNGEELVEEAIKSVLNQPCKDLEVIIMDDGSNDSTLSICNKYKEIDNRVRIFTHENMGLGKNRNIGFEYLTGKCTIFLDHDDKILNNFYTEDMKKFIEDCFKNNIELIVPARLRADYDMNKACLDKVDDEIVIGGNEASWNIKYEFATLIYKTSLLINNNIIFFEGKPEMESIFRHKAAYCAKKVLFTNKIYFGVRRANPASISNTWNKYNAWITRLIQYIELKKWHILYNPKDETAAENCDLIISDIIDELIDYAYLFNNSFEELIKTLDTIGYNKIDNGSFKYKSVFRKIRMYLLNQNINVLSFIIMIKYKVKKLKQILKNNFTSFHEYNISLVDFEKSIDFSMNLEKLRSIYNIQ